MPILECDMQYLASLRGNTKNKRYMEMYQHFYQSPMNGDGGFLATAAEVKKHL